MTTRRYGLARHSAAFRLVCVRRPALEVTGMSAHESSVRGQLAGLRTRGHACRIVSGGHLLAVASHALPGPVRMTAVVPTHRCGAVPDSHRVPSYDASRLADGANQLHRTPYGASPLAGGSRPSFGW
ncbi:hypothetical protein GCM10010361_11860 [Streptomyces olivaceiscleroticus]|uniref:Uncharacterized protein n=1 Tax=Streptomyces olivaceiscleroticus TaxID=68245 RepID=A0ABP3JCW7_9ACTN